MPGSLNSFWQGAASGAGRAISRAQNGLAGIAGGRLFRASTLSVLDQAVVSGTNFVTSVIIGRTCGAWELGAYYLALTLVLFARGVQEQLVGAPYMIYCQRKQPEELESFAGSALIHQLVLSLVAMLVLGGLWMFRLVPRELQPVIAVLIGGLPLLLLREFVREMAFAHLKPATALAVDTGVAVFQIGLLLTLGYLQLLSVPLAFIVIAGTSGVAALSWFLLKGRRLVGTWAAAWSDWWKNWSFSRWALAGQMLGQTTAYIMPWALAAAHGEAATGIFGACNTLVGLANMFVMGLSNFLSPRTAQAFAHGGLPELKRVLRQIIGLFVVTLGAFAAVSFIAGEWIATLLYGSTLNGSGMIIGLLALGLVANSISMACGNGLWAMERPAANFAADICVMAAVIVGSLLLIPTFGALGAAGATLFAHSTAATVRALTLLRVMREVAAAEVV